MASLSKRSCVHDEFGRNIRGIVRDFDALPLQTSAMWALWEDPGEILTSGQTITLWSFLESEGPSCDAGPDGFPAVLLLQRQLQIQHLGAKRPRPTCTMQESPCWEYASAGPPCKELEASKHFTPQPAI